MEDKQIDGEKYLIVARQIGREKVIEEKQRGREKKIMTKNHR